MASDPFIAAGHDGKHGFASRALAAAVARRMRARHHDPVSVYRCEVCHLWHVGMSARRSRRRPSTE